MPRVLLPAMDAPRLAQLQEAAPALQLITYQDAADALAKAGDAEGFYGAPTPELLRAAPRLRWIQVASAGVEAYLFPELVASDVVLTNAKVIYGSHLADHLMAFILAFNRNLPHLFRCQQQEVWESRANLRPMELSGETLLIVGLGGTGLALARRAAGFEMRILAVTRSPKPPTPGIEHIGRPDELHALLPQADHVAICCALTPQTYHLFGDREFRLMRQTAFIHSVTRGGIIDHEALLRALRGGEIAGAGLDVTEPEPLPPGHPLWQLPNVLITPHASGHSPHSGRRMFDLLRENLRRFAAGEPLLNVVDKAVGA
ncbi:MAG TPA: D-2-hydroxyacid dehydrogenase [Chloroflexota bacterium]|nr:D-2-hydroxyacid dehydrogenase [Chloroflexota bacterium]